MAKQNVATILQLIYIYMKKYDRQKCWPYFQVLGISFEKEPSKIIRFAYDVSR